MLKKVILLILCILIVSCSTSQENYESCDSNKDGTISELEKTRCLNSNGELEKRNLDELENDIESEDNGIEPIEEETESEDTEEKESLGLPIYLSSMTHMEGGHSDDKIEGVFNTHVKQLTWGMDLADEYGAKLTIETEIPFATANTLYDNNIMLEIYERGHGVGTHCDIGAHSERDGMSYEEFVEGLIERKELVNNLVDADNNWGCSGAGSHLDWVSALQEAGFIYVNGIVGFHLLGLPENTRPEGYSDNAISNQGHYHDHIPTDILDRTYLIQLENIEDLEDDGKGLVMSAGSLGMLSAIAEGGYESGTHISDAEYNNDDVDKLIELIYYIDENRDLSKVSKVDFYFPANHWDSNNEDVLRYFFSEMQGLENKGIIKWATQKEVVETYLSVN